MQHVPASSPAPTGRLRSTGSLRPARAPQSTLSTRSIDRLSKAHDASHYLLVPASVATPRTVDDVARLVRDAAGNGSTVTFRSGGTSLSGQAVTDGILADTRSSFRHLEVLDAGSRVRVEPGVTVRQVNAALARFGRKLGPDPASEIACTIGGVVANNSSGMACGTVQNSYRTVDSLTIVLASGTVLDTGAADARRILREREPELHAGLLRLRDRVRGDRRSVDAIRRMFAMKNTMGYGINAFLDYEEPLDILAHLLIGSEGTLGFIAEVTFHTVPLLPFAATALAVFPSLEAATAALPAIVETAPATVELMDTVSLRVAQSLPQRTAAISDLVLDTQTALLVEYQDADPDSLRERVSGGARLLEGSGLSAPAAFTADPDVRSRLWSIRKGLYASVAGARPVGTTALLEDIAVPVDALLGTCSGLTELFDRYGYEESVVFGHAKDGNLHFMLNERFDDPSNLDRYRAFTEDMVDLVLGHSGTLKAEHGTGRIMAGYVRRQYGDELYAVMQDVKRLFDPRGILNPGSVLSDDPDAFLENLKSTPPVESEVDRCVECGYCEPVCPSKDLTLTPRGRIVLRREMVAAEARGDDALLEELQRDYEYEGVETCAVDGMCRTACPVGINTGDLVRRLRAENTTAVAEKGWAVAAGHWDAATRAGAAALTVAAAAPPRLVRTASVAARKIFDEATVPRYDDGLPRGGHVRRPRSAEHPAAVFLPSCTGTMFGPEDEGIGVMEALLRLCDRADVAVLVPEGIASFCCGTPWKSKGHLAGYERMRDLVLPALLAASDGGRIPVICDATSCTEGLETMRQSAEDAGGAYASLRFVDAIEFVRDTLLDRLPAATMAASVSLHPTCSSAQLGVNGALTAVAARLAVEVDVPVNWGCCAFAGDRGMLHPELTASATAAEAAEVCAGDFELHASTNRTCEIGMTRATGKSYRHILELLEEATRVS